jgi:hypothetical protein
VIDKDLTLALCALQEAVQRACIAAKRAGDEATYHELRKLAWSTAAILASVARDQAVAS